MAEMEMLGGLMDEGGTVDPVSGNEVPSGSTQEEVRDDIPAQLSEGEFVFPADVVRYIGLENLMKMRSMAKAGLAKMEAMGQMGNSEEAIISDTIPFSDPIDQFIDEMDQDDPVMFQVGGLAGQPTQQQPTGNFLPPGVTRPTVSATTPPPKISPSESGIPVYETRKFIGPDGTIRTFTFLDGKPIQNIPEGFNPYVEPEAQPEVTPEVAPTQRRPSDDDDDGRDLAEEARLRSAASKLKYDVLSSFSPKLKEVWNNDPAKTGQRQFPAISILRGLNTRLTALDEVENIVNEANKRLKGTGSQLNAEDYTNPLTATTKLKEDIQQLLDVTDADGEAIPSTPSVARSTQTIVDSQQRKAEEEQAQIDVEADKRFNKSLQGQANIAPEDVPSTQRFDFDVSAPKQEAVKPVEQPIETKQDDTGVPAAQRLQDQRLDPLGVAPNLGEAQRQQLGIDFDEESAADETPLNPFTEKLKEGVRVQPRSFAAGDRPDIQGTPSSTRPGIKSSAFQRAKDLTTPQQRRDLEEQAAFQESTREYSPAYDSSDREGGDPAQDVGGGTVGGQGGGLSGPFKKGGLASLKTKTKPKKKMKRGGLASKK
jgi:hypothetical protein